MFNKTDRTALFIDGANLFAAARTLDFDIDYKKLRSYFAEKCIFVRALYYTALIEDQDRSPLRPLIDWLDYNGYTLVTKAAKEFTDDAGVKKVKGNMDIELAVDMLEMAPVLDHMVLFSGDGDFRRLIETLQFKGVRVTCVSTMRSQPSMIADELRRQADHFIDLADLKKQIGNDSSRNNGSPHSGRKNDQLEMA